MRYGVGRRLVAPLFVFWHIAALTAQKEAAGSEEKRSTQNQQN